MNSKEQYRDLNIRIVTIYVLDHCGNISELGGRKVDTIWTIRRYIDSFGNDTMEETVWPGLVPYKDVVKFDTLGNQVAKLFLKDDSIINRSSQEIIYNNGNISKVSFYNGSSELLAITKHSNQNRVEIDSQLVIEDSIMFVTIYKYDKEDRLKKIIKYHEDEIVQEDYFTYKCGFNEYVMTHSTEGKNMKRFTSEQKFILDAETNLISSQEMKSWEYTDSTVEESCATWVYHYDYYKH